MARAGEENRRPDIEEFLTKQNVTHTYKPKQSIDKFNVEKSLRNQARLGKPLNDPTVKDYVEDLHNGDVFPPLLVEVDRDGKYLILDGNHRLAAHREVGLAPDVYICEASAQALVLITFLANTKHGLPASEEDRLHHAMFLVDNGVPLADAAMRLSVTKSALRILQTRQTATRRADECGILRTEWERLPDTSRQRLANIGTDEGFKSTFKLVLEAGLNSTEINKVVNHLNETRSGARQVAMINSLRDGFKDRIASNQVAGRGNRKGGAPTSPRSRLSLCLGQVLALPAPVLFEAMPPAVAAEMIEKLDAAVAVMNDVRKALSG